MKFPKLIKYLTFIILNSLVVNAYHDNWKQVYEVTGNHIIAFSNAVSNYIMAVAQNGSLKKIIKTTDGGETWKYVYRDIDSFINGKWPKYARDIAYPTKNLCIVSLDTNSLMKTTDGGETWNEYQVEIPYQPLGFGDIDMYDSNNGAMFSDRYVVVSHDGFKTWDTLPSPQGFMIYCGSMASPNSICVLSRDIDGSPDFNERFYRSDDIGKTWNEYPHPDYRIPQRIKFVDSLIGFEVGGKRTGLGNQQYELIFKTSDGGRTWEKVLDTIIGYSFGLQDLDFYDKDNGIVVGQFGAIFWTHDGGKSWQFDSSAAIWDGIPPTLSVCYFRKYRAIIGDFMGRIFMYSGDTTDVVDNKPQTADDYLLYPNPATNIVRIKTPLSENGTQKIFNSYGQEIEGIKQKRINENEIEFDVSPLPAGAYFAVINDKGKIHSKPFVVMR